jgi:hypothetical protein
LNLRGYYLLDSGAFRAYSLDQPVSAAAAVVAVVVVVVAVVAVVVVVVVAPDR